jgi:hypothetical protein
MEQVIEMGASKMFEKVLESAAVAPSIPSSPEFIKAPKPEGSSILPWILGGLVLAAIIYMVYLYKNDKPKHQLYKSSSLQPENNDVPNERPK